MQIISILLQILIGFGILNVWLLRSGKKTVYRGGNSHTLRQEFEAYGLPEALFYLVGALKIASAIALIVGIWISSMVIPAAICLAVLMLGAIAMHVKVSDPPIRSLPAVTVLSGTVLLIVLQLWA